MNVLSPLVRTVLLVKITLDVTDARVNLDIQTGTVRQVSCLVKLNIIFSLTEPYSKKAPLKVVLLSSWTDSSKITIVNFDKALCVPCRNIGKKS